eukprot:2306835-Alexandrium_andersonii.AAC.1
MSNSSGRQFKWRIARIIAMKTSYVAWRQSFTSSVRAWAERRRLKESSWPHVCRSRCRWRRSANPARSLDT